MSTRRFMTTEGQGQSLTFIQGQSDSAFSNFFSSTNIKSFQAKFLMELPWDVGMKSVQIFRVT